MQKKNSKLQLLENKIRKMVKEEMLKEEEVGHTPEEVAEILKQRSIPDVWGYVTTSDCVIFIGKNKIFVTNDFKYGKTTGRGHSYEIDKI